MSRTTDRLSNNQQLIDLAKKQYEQTKHKSLLPPIVVPLASRGLVYAKDNPLREGFIEMRVMTAYDEDILTNPTYLKRGIALEKLLDALIVTPGVQIDDIHAFDQEVMLMSSRISAYGNEYPVITVDPKTAKQLDRKIELSNLKMKNFDLTSDDNGEFDYNISDDIKIKFAFLTPNQTKKVNDEQYISTYLQQTIREINGDRSVERIEDFIKYELLPKHSKKFRTYIIDNTPGLNYDIEIEGEDGSTFITRFQYGSDFFRV